MINIKPDVHTSTTVVSLDRALRKSEIYGDVKVTDLYLMTTVYALLNTMCLDLTNKQRKNLISYYNKLAFKSKDICTNVMLEAFKQPMSSKFSVSYVDPSTIVKNKNVNYWKANFTQTEDEVIETLTKSFLESKSSTTLNQLNEGFNYVEQGIGRICFFMNTLSNPDIVKVEDVLNNDVTNSFDIAYIPTLNGVFIISKNMYTSEPINLKIKVNEHN